MTRLGKRRTVNGEQQMEHGCRSQFTVHCSPFTNSAVRCCIDSRIDSVQPEA
jgi:hypothetical protein